MAEMTPQRRLYGKLTPPATPACECSRPATRCDDCVALNAEPLS